MESKYDKRWTVYWSFKLAGEATHRKHTNVFNTKTDADLLLNGLKHLACRDGTFKAKIIQEEVIDVA